MSEITHITTSGGLITQAFIDNIRQPATRQPGTEPASFAPSTGSGRGIHGRGPKSPAELEDDIAAAWELLKERWDAVHDEIHDMSVSDVRARWLIPLFQILDFDPQYQRGDTVIDDALRFDLSHRGWAPDKYAIRNTQYAIPPILHTVAPSQSLDQRAGPGRTMKAKSPHDMLQAFLNLSLDDQWAVLTNGIVLRLLRDYHHTFTKGYVEFDLESIFETRNYGDFRALYRMCHASRFVPAQTFEVSETSKVFDALPLETFYKTALATGIKAGEDLRGQVRQAIETLGNGFLDGELIRRLQDDPQACQAYYSEILRVIYRILFLLFAEQRGLLPHAGAELEDLYRNHYSITALRSRAEGDIPRHDDRTDLWHGLQVTFRMVRDGAEALGVFGYDGMLFEDPPASLLHGADESRSALVGARQAGDQVSVNLGTDFPLASPLQNRACPNHALLQAIRALTLIEREGVLQRISYADLGVEELGSIYESLLEFTPRVTTAPEDVGGREIPANTPSTGSGRRFFLDPRGLERKSTGSYYTHPSLVNELIRSALLPVMRDRLAGAGLPVAENTDPETRRQGERERGRTSPCLPLPLSPPPLTGLLTDYAGLTDAQRTAGEDALLNITVCDSAAGSGHFLVKANNVLGAELARIRTGDEYPSEHAVQQARRDVLAECIYAVDLNPMAVELCKVSLWINASVADRPLSFLDHHIKCGNSLIGATPELLEDGVPADAFALGRPGDDREMTKAMRARNRQERRDYEQSGGYQMQFRVTLIETLEDLMAWSELRNLATADPRLARERYAEYITSDAYRRQKLEADFWTAAFFWPMPEGTDWAPTFGEFMRLRHEGPEALPAERLAQISALADEHRFFHWHLEFEEVFQTSEVSETSEVSGGFDVVLGNPPWERIKLQEKEFFADKAPAIANASTAARRRKLIRKLPEEEPALYREYQAALYYSECLSGFLRQSGRYPLSAVGDINTYQVFAGLARQVVGPRGRVGMVVPSGIATDYYNQDYFSTIVENRELVSLYDFENREGIFPEVHRSYKFCLLTLTGEAAPAGEIDFAFFLTRADQLPNDERHFTLTRDDLRRINPNTGTCPTFRSWRNAELTKKIYQVCPVLHNEESGENPWSVSFLRMFDMTNDSHLFRTRDDLEVAGLHLGEAARFVGDGEVLLPLYEGRMISHFDHRVASVGVSEETTFRSGVTLETSPAEHADPDYSVLPRYWVSSDAVQKAVPSAYERGWFIGFKDVTSPTNERTLICSVVPWTAVGNKIPLFLCNAESERVCGLFANLSAYVFDFIVRQKIGGVSLNFYIVKQLPVLPPSHYTPDLLTFIVPRVLELTYTAWDIKAFADDVWREAAPSPGPSPEIRGGESLRAAIRRQWEENVAETGGHVGAEPPDWVNPKSEIRNPKSNFPHPPFKWDEDRRAHLRAELDAVYAHLYGLTRDELAYILDTFPIVRRKDEAKYGEFRTKRLVLEQFESLASLPLI